MFTKSLMQKKQEVSIVNYELHITFLEYSLINWCRPLRLPYWDNSTFFRNSLSASWCMEAFPRCISPKSQRAVSLSLSRWWLIDSSNHPASLTGSKATAPRRSLHLENGHNNSPAIHIADRLYPRIHRLCFLVCLLLHDTSSRLATPSSA